MTEDWSHAFIQPSDPRWKERHPPRKLRESLTVLVTDHDRQEWSINGLRGQIVWAADVARAAGFKVVDCVTASIDPDGILFHFEVTT